MKSFFFDFIHFTFVYFAVTFANHYFNLELKEGYIPILSIIISEMMIMGYKLDVILESRKTDNYSDGVGIK